MIGVYWPTKFKPCVLSCLVCRLERMKRRKIHVQCTCDAHPLVSSSHGVIKASSRYISGPNLVLPARKLPNLEDPLYTKFHPSGTCAWHLPVTDYNDTSPPITAGSPHCLNPVRPVVWPVSLRKWKEVQAVYCTLYVQCQPQVSYSYSIMVPSSKCTSVWTLVLLAQKWANSEDPMHIKFFPSWHVPSHSSVPAITVAHVYPWW